MCCCRAHFIIFWTRPSHPPALPVGVPGTWSWLCEWARTTLALTKEIFVDIEFLASSLLFIPLFLMPAMYGRGAHKRRSRGRPALLAAVENLQESRDVPAVEEFNIQLEEDNDEEDALELPLQPQLDRRQGKGGGDQGKGKGKSTGTAAAFSHLSFRSERACFFFVPVVGLTCLPRGFVEDVC